MMGISRSATIVIAYLMNRFGMSLPQAFSYVKAKRPEIGPNRHFMRTLVQYEQELRYPKSAMQNPTSRNITPVQRNYATNNGTINSNYNNNNTNNQVNSVNSTVPATRNKKRHHNKSNQQQRPMSALVSESKQNYQRETENNHRNYTPFFPSELIPSNTNPNTNPNTNQIEINQNNSSNNNNSNLSPNGNNTAADYYMKRN